MMTRAPMSLLLLGLVFLAAFAAANPGHHHHSDPCAVGRDRWTWGASEGEELDAEAMQAMPLPFVQYGWRIYTSKTCSYKGVEAPCPTLQHYHDHPSFNEVFWDTLFPGRKPDGSGCTNNNGCCSGNCADNKCCAAGKGKIGDDCTTTQNAGCCSGVCTSNACAAAP